MTEPQEFERHEESPDLRFARTPGRDVFGKLDDRLPEIRVPFEIRQLAERAAHEEGVDLSTWMRDLFYARLLTPEHVARMYQQRAERALGNAVQIQALAKVRLSEGQA